MQALSRIKESDILFFDIETATVLPELGKPNSATYDSWAYYCKNNDIDDIEGSYLKKGALYAEYSRVVCISVGIITKEGTRIKTIRGDEHTILEKFATLLQHKDYYLCGHYIKGFDIPFLMRRYIVNGLTLPPALDVSDKKPWEVKHIDTAELWKGSGWQRSTLVSICLALGIDSPKAGFDGSDVSRMFHEGKVDDIILYCERDVEALIKVYKKLV